MPWKGLKLHIIILSLLIGIGIIFGAQQMHRKYYIERPVNNVLSADEAIESYRLENEGGTLLISVKIKGDAGLMVPYQGIRKNLEQVMGSRSYVLELDDQRDDILDRVWYKSQYAVYQAQVRGSFIEMAEIINREASMNDVEADITIDQEYIYLRLRHEDCTLDKIIPRGAGGYSGDHMLVAGGSAND
ncbi:MAG: hypothetical protein GX325_03350 [Peptococcaceae bacterium]|nr:hypothetical protein [Peptococcaceae bacterium]